MAAEDKVCDWQRFQITDAAAVAVVVVAGNRHATDAALLEIMAMVMVFANRFIFHYFQWQQTLSSALIGQCLANRAVIRAPYAGAVACSPPNDWPNRRKQDKGAQW